jgi:oligopeptide transport system permease protein
VSELDNRYYEKADAANFTRDRIARPQITYWGDAWRRLKQNPVAVASIVVIAIMVLGSILGPPIHGVDFHMIRPLEKNQGMSALYWFGTDNMGRDLFGNLCAGFKVSLIIALVCGAVQVIAGSLIGGIMAYAGGITDAFFLRVIEILLSIPSLLITMVLMMVFGHSTFSLLLAISITSWCNTARQIRGQVLQLREIEYILAAEVLGAGKFRTIIRHLLPNTIGIIIVNLTSSIPGYIFMEAGLSFIGLGLLPPDISLGTLISAGQRTMDFYPYQIILPCIVLCLTVLAFNLLGDGLRNALDPRMRR